MLGLDHLYVMWIHVVSFQELESHHGLWRPDGTVDTLSLALGGLATIIRRRRLFICIFKELLAAEVAMVPHPLSSH